MNLDDEGKVIENIRLGKVMEVCLEETKNEDNFEIFTNSSKEQFIAEDDFTEWIFNVKAKKEGLFILVIKVTLIQIIEGFGERKRDIVLERNVKTEAFVPEAVTSFETSTEKFLGSNSPELPSDLASISPPITTPPTPTITPKKSFPILKIMLFSASIIVICIPSVLMFPEIKSAFQASTEHSTTILDERENNSTLPSQGSNEHTIKLPTGERTHTIQPPPPHNNQGIVHPGNNELPQFPIPNNGVLASSSSLVLIGVKKGTKKNTIAFEANDFFFLVDYFALDSLKLDSAFFTTYNAQDTVFLTGNNIKESKISEIKDSLQTGSLIKNNMLKAQNAGPNVIHN